MGKKWGGGIEQYLTEKMGGRVGGGGGVDPLDLPQMLLMHPQARTSVILYLRGC